MPAPRLVAFATHPIQYQVPVYRRLQEMGLDVTVIYGSDFSTQSYRDTEFGTDVAWDIDLESGYTPVYLARVADGASSEPSDVSSRGVGRALAQARPDVVMLTGYGLRFHQGTILAGLTSGKPLVFRAESTDHAEPRSSVKSAFRTLLLKLLYSRMALCFYTGQNSLRHFQRLRVPARKLAFAPYCVDASPFQTTDADRAVVRDRVRQDLGIPDGNDVLLFSGKLSRRKGVDILLNAVKALPEADRERITLLYLGDGALRKELEGLAAQTPPVDVRFVGFKPQKEISPYFHAADVLVLPSVQGETWGLVVNDALHHGLPVIASQNVGSSADLVLPGKTGEIVETGSVDSLRAALQRWLAWGTQSAEERDRCRTHVAGYSTEVAAQAIFEGVQKVLAQNLTA